LAELLRKRVVPTPVILQMEAVECGAAALAIILAHHGAWISLEQLRIACGVSRDGSKASNIIRAARRYGLVARGYSVEPQALSQLPMPCIIHWNFNHFVVLEGINRARAYINDPATGRRRVSMEELDLAFTGVVLAFERGAEFKKLGAKPNGISLLLRELRHSKAAVALLVIASIALVVPNIIAAGFSKIFVDDILIQHMDSWLAPLLIGIALTAACRAILVLVRQSVLLRLQTKLAVVTTSRFLWRLLALPFEFFTQRHAGDVASRVASNEQIARLLSGGVTMNALSLTSVLLFGAAMAVYDVPLAALCVAISFLNVLLLRIVAARRQDLSYQLAVEQGKLLGATVGIVRSIETIKASGLEDDAFSKWAGLQANNLKRRTEAWRVSHHPRYGSNAALGPDRRRYSWPGRVESHSGLTDARQPRCIPITRGKLRRAVWQSRQLFRWPANDQGGSRAARGYLQVPASIRTIEQGAE
jgi:ABC-type bacteriocin/lantibiotic exporter with double-glycine peptidase domain